jgi:hypothetical protein
VNFSGSEIPEIFVLKDWKMQFQKFDLGSIEDANI